MEEDVYRAIADPTRRELMDALFRQDGQTLGELESQFEMSRFGVMKHLKVLEEAHLVVTRRRGREKLHFLNTVPVRLMYERWVSKYSEPWAATLTGLKDELERRMEKVYEIYIRTTPDVLWHAIVTPEIRAKYNFGATLYSDFEKGSSFTMKAGEFMLGEGEIVEIDPPTKLVQTMTALWGDDVKAEGVTRITWEIEKIADDSCLLKVTHDQMRENANDQIYGGWPMILSGLKTWIETGELLTTPGSLRYS